MDDSAQKQIKRLQRQLDLAKQALRQDRNIREKYQETLKQLRQKEHFATTLIESNSDAVIVIDAKQKVLVYNKRAQELFGHSKQQL